MTTRRTFLIALGAGVLAVPRGSLAQPQSKGARIGFLYYGSRQSSLDTGRYNAFVQGFNGTQSDNVTIVSVAGNAVTVKLAATQTSGAVHNYQGTYTVTNGVITGSSIQPAS